ncbi:HNH/endonuclease VII fold putative polymorphic toxin [Pyxidicoccus sp. MSG2]|uniref:NHL domain-containing protein n=1 Tax=Pyxidicoccus sp. MSG2 TaxID=2996790 RepID=UPI00226E9255|nr:HNH/endonuclease VII fold putative polymorphic toxin [Pyxidicoccus sp. MSG2]MCY1019272.1 HNH/endonuclease VII fold putative polymorphic toxin [Pyxidicoccus sp. MSG2]
MTRFLVVGVLLALAVAGPGCSCEPDPKPDAGTRLDAGPGDAGSGPDSGFVDAGTDDAGTGFDAGPDDAGSEPDGGSVDAGPDDAGTEPDGGFVDAGPEPDAGVDTLAPTWPEGAALGALSVGSSRVLLRWSAAVDDVAVTTYRLLQDGTVITEVAAEVLEREVAGLTPGSRHTFQVEALDARGNLSSGGPSAVVEVVPPPPELEAPALDRSVATTLVEAASFLFTGEDPPQRGVDAGTFTAQRLAVLRGQVLSPEGEALAGVRLRVLDHPEYGVTHSREDGFFDLAVNGGGALTLVYEKDGVLPAQRTVTVPWQDYVWLPTVALVPLDARHTLVEAGAPVLQVAQGTPVADADGARQQTLLFAPGTSATLVLSDGGTAALSTLSIRATEYTVGEQGVHAMPAALPPQSGYTYAVELTADEALAAGAREVRFEPPVISYVENFIGFPVGGIVPAGYYDRERATWLASDNGRVIAVLGRTAGLADLDVDGDGSADGAEALAALGITDAERERLADLYAPGQSLWRTPIPHFSPWDFNWPKGPPPGAKPPNTRPPRKGPDSLCKQQGSIIGCEARTLGEALPITGTPFGLVYQSDRAPGRHDAYTLPIQLSDESMPETVRRIDLHVYVAGQFHQRSFPASIRQHTTFTWDGKDAYGRTVQGRQPVVVQVGYIYDAVYQNPSQLQAAFGAFGSGIAADKARNEVSLWTSWQDSLGAWDARPLGLGGWTLDVHHGYDPLGRVLHLGNGEQRGAEALGAVITRVAGQPGQQGCCADEGPATSAYLDRPRGLAVGADGSLYIADFFNSRIRKVDPSGVIHTIAGTGTPGSAGEGGPAASAQVYYPFQLALGPDGSLYFTENGGGRVGRITPDGRLVRVAGNGLSGNAPDGVPALQAPLGDLWGIAVGPDGSVYVADRANHRVRRISPDGILSTLAGNGEYTFHGDGGPATQAALWSPIAVAVGPDGSVYIADFNNLRVRRVGTDGIIRTVAGNGFGGATGDGGPATQATLQWPLGLAVGPDGRLYIVDNYSGRLRMVDGQGIITTVAGAGIDDASGDGGPALRAQLFYAYSLALSPDGHSLYLPSLSTVRKVASPLPGLVGDTYLPSADGSEVYLFSARGRHLRTVDALSNVTLHAFGYDAGGRLTDVTDAEGRFTRVERDGAGQPAAIVSPEGDRTTLALGADGYLSRVTNAANESVRLEYRPGGLLTKLTDPRGHEHLFTYDGEGRLVRDEDPAGGWKSLERTDAADGFSVRVSTALGRTTTYAVQWTPAGDTVRRITDAAGSVTTAHQYRSGLQVILKPDGSRVETLVGPDPRFGMMVPVPVSVTQTLPSGLTLRLAAGRSATLADPGNLLSLTGQTETTTLNGRHVTRAYDAAARQWTSDSPGGRRRLTLFDERNRLVEERAPGVPPVLFAYDARGLLLSTTRGTRETRLTYDARGNLETLTDALFQVSRYGYDPVGRLTYHLLPGEREVRYAHDASGNLTSLTPPGRAAHAYTFTKQDLPEVYTPPETGMGEGVVGYSYDLDQQLTRVLRPDGTTVDFAYDTAGRVETVTTARGTVSSTYEPVTGRLTRLAAPDGITLAYDYDGSLMTGTTWAGPVSGSVRATYDDQLEVRSLDVRGTSLSLGYDADGLLTTAGVMTLEREAATGRLRRLTVGGLETVPGYDGYGELSNERTTSGASEVFAQAYVRDDLGRITQRTETEAGESVVHAYAYDAAGRLTDVRRDGVTVEHYAYDVNGNRTRASNAGGDVAATHDAQDRLLTQGDRRYTWSAAGELRSRVDEGSGIETAYTYDALGNLMRVEREGSVVEYLVDGENRRIGRRLNGTLTQGWLYQGDRIVGELDGDGQLVSLFVYGTRSYVPDYFVRLRGTASDSRTGTFRIVTDHVGSPRRIVDVDTAEVVQALDYDAFGKVLRDTRPGFQPFGFVGGLYDAETGLVRFGARDYDAETGRWTAKDPLRFGGGDTNLYAYVGGDPVNFVDPSGLIPLDTAVDVGFLLYDISQGDCDAIKMDLLGMAIPYVSAGMLRPLKGLEIAKALPTRRGALNQARRDLGIPRSQQPQSVNRVPMTDPGGNRILNDARKPIMTREYTYTRPDGSKVVIQDHSAGHRFGEGVGDQGPHFNVRPPENTRTGKVPGTLDHYLFGP